MITNKYKQNKHKGSMIKLALKPEEINPSYNHPKTYAIVYKGTEIVVKEGSTEMYFRSKRIADEYLYNLERAFLTEAIEIIQLQHNKNAEILLERLGIADNTNPRRVRPRSSLPYINKTGSTLNIYTIAKEETNKE